MLSLRGIDYIWYLKVCILGVQSVTMNFRVFKHNDYDPVFIVGPQNIFLSNHLNRNFLKIQNEFPSMEKIFTDYDEFAGNLSLFEMDPSNTPDWSK